MLALMAEREQFRSLSAAKVQKVLDNCSIRPHLFNNIKAKCGRGSLDCLPALWFSFSNRINTTRSGDRTPSR